MEPDAWIDTDRVRRNASRLASSHALGQERMHFGHHVVVMRRDLHRPRLALHVHQAHRRVALGHRLQRAGARQRAHELVARGHMLDGLVTISGCDKTIPAMAMALGRMNVPGISFYSGSILSGKCTKPSTLFEGRKLTIQEIYEAVGAFNAGRIGEEELRDVEDLSEYLAPTVNIDTGMPANTPIAVELQLIDPGSNAINFEFEMFNLC